MSWSTRKATKSFSASARRESSVKPRCRALAARCRPGRDRIPAQSRRGRRHSRRRRRRRLRDHRLHADEKSRVDLRQSASFGPRAQQRRYRHHGACRRLPRLQRADRLAGLRRRAAERSAPLLRRHRAARLRKNGRRRAGGPSSERAGRSRAFLSRRKAFSRAPYTFTASTSSAPSRTSSPTTSKPKNTSKCSSPAWCS